MITVMTNGDHFFSSNNQINISPERVEIVNPGRLMFPKEELGKRSAQRNPLMTDMVLRIGMVEKAGSGLKRMRKSMKEYDLELVFEISSFFSAVFHRDKGRKSDANPTKTGRNGYWNTKESSSRSLKDLKIVSIKGYGKGSKWILREKSDHYVD